MFIPFLLLKAEDSLEFKLAGSEN